MCTNLWQARKPYNLFSLLENETMGMFSMGKRSKRKHEFGGTKVCEAEEEIKYFINPKLKNKVFC